MSLQSNVYITQSGSVYLKKAGTFARYTWGGLRMRLDESTQNMGGMSITTKFAARGGIQRDSILRDVPSTVDFAVAMKRVQGERMRSELLKCFWNVDERVSCGGRDRDDPAAWAEITRRMWSRANARTMPAGSWEGEEESVINIPFNGLEEYDIYRLQKDESDPTTAAVSLTDVAVASAEQCVGCDDIQEDAVFIAVSTAVAAGTPYMYYNLSGGTAANWTEVGLTGWAGNATAVLALGNFISIVGNTDAEIKRFNSPTSAQVDVTHASFAAHPPACIDGIDQSWIIIGGEDGYIYASFDGARTIETLLSGTVTTEDITAVSIARDNPNVVWAGGTNNALVMTENAGLTWVAVTGPSAGNDLLEIVAVDATSLLIVDDSGVIYQTTDGGVTWGTQTALSGIPASLTNAKISLTEADVFYLALAGATGNLYRNVEGGSSGYWEPITPTPTQPMMSIAAVCQNVAVAVGGDGSINAIASLIA